MAAKVWASPTGSYDWCAVGEVLMSEEKSTGQAPLGQVMVEVGSGFLLLDHSGVPPVLAFVLVVFAVYLFRRQKH